MADARSFCPHCYAPLISGRKTCPKCGRNVSDAPPSQAPPAKERGAVPFALLGALLVVIALGVALLLFLK